MKRLLISVFAAAAALFATSCAQDGLDNSAAKGEEAVVTFAVNAPEMATRALFGDGTSANQLFYAVYDEENKVLDAISVIDNPETINISKNVSLRLVNGNTYSLIFWAQNADGVVDIDWDAQTMAYAPTAMSAEAYDAFWAYVEPFTVNGAMQKNVDLFRPFAQVIIGAGDYEDAVAAGLTVTETQFTVTTPSAMSLVDGTASAPAEFTYAYAALPTETFPVADHQHMGMSYLLFGADKGMVDIKFDYKDAANTEYTRNLPAVPVQRNYRTIIYGNLLTSQADFNVKIVPEMEDIEWPLETEYTAVSTLAELQAALDAAKAGEKTAIKFAANIKGDVNITEKADATIAIDGCGFEYDGTMTFIGGTNYQNATTQITNLNFVADEAKTFIYGDASTGNARYVDNVTILDCTFTANVAAGVDVVGAKLRALKGAFNLINCEATGLHTLVQTNSCGEGDVLVDNCVIDGKNGVSFTNGTKSAKVANSTIVATGYGVRSDARTANEALNVENCDITAELPVVIRDMNKNDGFTLTFAGANNFVGGAGYDAVLTDGDDGTFIIPTKSYTLVGAEGYKVFPDNADELTVGGESATEAAAAFAAAMESDATLVNVEAPIEQKGLGFKIESDKKIDYNGQEFNAGSDANSTWYALQVYGEETDVEIDNANFTRAGVAALDGAKVVFNSGTIDHNPERTSRYIFLAGDGGTVTINDGTFLNDRAKNRYFYAYNGGTIYVNGGNFGGVASTNKLYLANGGQLIISGGTFNFDPTEWLADGYVAVKSGSTWTVQAE